MEGSGSMKMSAWFAAALLLAGCTNGAASLTPGGGGGTPGGGGGGGNVVNIDVNLTLDAPSTVPAGQAGGFAPALTNVRVGDTVHFTNSDGTGINHTATLVPGASTFPAGSPFTTSAQTRSGTAITDAWSSGILSPGSSSQSIAITAAGTYIYGCFYHYGSPMRGEIVAQ
jgi:plastocyanin